MGKNMARFGRGGILLFASCLALTGGAISVATPAVAATVCEPGSPITYDYSGDGIADLDSVKLQRPEAASANLNGDKCADLVWLDGNSVNWVLGDSESFDFDAVISQAMDIPEFTKPWTSTADDVEILAVSSMRTATAGSQIFVAAAGATDGTVISGTQHLDVIDLNAAGTSGTVTPIDLRDRSASTADVSIASDAGVVVIGEGAKNAALIYTTSATSPGKIKYRKTLTQNSSGVPGTTESGDRFGASVAVRSGRIAIGSPGESLGKAKRTGAVQPILWKSSNTYTAYRSISQGTKGVPGSNETNDAFGSAVAIGSGLTASDSYDVVIGTPGETVGAAVKAGAASVVNFTKSLAFTYTKSSGDLGTWTGGAKADEGFGTQAESVGKTGAERVVISGVPEPEIRCSLPVYFTSPGKLTQNIPWSQVTFVC